MKRFLTRVSIFLLPLLIFIVFAEWQLKTKEDIYKFKKRHLEAALNTIEILTLGNSHALAAFRPESFSLAGFNLGFRSQSLYYDAMLALTYIEQLPKLKIVLVPISSFSFWYNLESTNIDWRESFYNQTFDIRPESGKQKLSDFSKLKLYGFKKSLSYLFLKQNDKDLRHISQSGWEGRTYNPLKISDRKGKKRAEFHKSICFEANSGKNLESLHALLRELSKRDIKCVLVTTPTYGTYYHHLDKGLLLESKKIINQLVDKYSCSYFNYLKDNRFNKEDFYDNDHLNSEGAEKFSQIIDNEIIRNYLKIHF